MSFKLASYPIDNMSTTEKLHNASTFNVVITKHLELSPVSMFTWKIQRVSSSSYKIMYKLPDLKSRVDALETSNEETLHKFHCRWQIYLKFHV